MNNKIEKREGVSIREKAAEWVNNSFSQVGDRYVFLDTGRHEQLSLDTPPSSLAQDEELKTGYEFLAEFGESLDVKIVYSQHHGAEHLGAAGSFEKDLNNADVLLLERLGWTEEHLRAVNELADTSYLHQRAYTALVGTEFDKRIFNALAGSKKHVGFFDINAVEGNELRSTLIAVSDLLTDIVRDHPETTEKQRTGFIHWATFQNTRDWFMVGQFGHEVARLCQNNPELLEKLAKKELRILMPVGSVHRNFGARLKKYGVRINEHATGVLSNTNEFIRSAIEKGYISVDELTQITSDART